MGDLANPVSRVVRALQQVAGYVTELKVKLAPAVVQGGMVVAGATEPTARLRLR
jgi:hypothetical protein